MFSLLIRQFLRPRLPYHSLAGKLYEDTVARARDPILYQAPYLIPDSFDGRFDALLLHATLLMFRVQTAAHGAVINQSLFDCMFNDFEQNNRQIGIGDMSILRHFRRMSAAFNGRRIEYYRIFTQEDAAGLVQALTRNVYRLDSLSCPQAVALAEYVWRQKERLSSVPDSDIVSGKTLWLDANPTGDPTRGNENTRFPIGKCVSEADTTAA